MKKIFIVLLVIFNGLSKVEAQNLILDGDAIALSQNSTLTIDPSSGDVIATSVNGNLSCIDGSSIVPPSLSFSVNDGSVDPGDNVILSWTVANADVCVASSTNSGWNGNESSANGSYNETITNIQETTIFALNCASDFGSIEKSVAVVVDNGSTGPSDIPVLSFSSSPTQLPSSGGDVVLSWNVTGADSCTASGGWSGSQAASNGPHSVTINNVTPPQTFTLRCDNGAGPTSRSVTVSTESSTTCNAQPPINLARQTLIDIPIDNGGGTVGSTFQEVVGTPFGASTGNNANFALEQNKYVALAFTAPNGVFNNKKLTFENGRPSEGGPSNGYTISISECPGDFSVTINQDRCLRTSNTPTLKWGTNPADDSRCQLVPGQQYYLNIVHSTDTAGGYQNSACSLQPGFDGCGVLMNEVGVN